MVNFCVSDLIVALSFNYAASQKGEHHTLTAKYWPIFTIISLADFEVNL